MFKKDLKSSFLGVLILLLGVVVGVILVRQTQEFRNKAKEAAENLYTVCHKTGDAQDSWTEVEVKSEELSKYLNGGDIFGECPEELETR